MDENILSEITDGLRQALGSNVVRIILYGSVARKEATPDSDTDIAVLLKNAMDCETEDRLSDFLVDMNLKYDRVFSVIDISYSHYMEWRCVSPFFINMEKDGVTLWQQAA